MLDGTVRCQRGLIVEQEADTRFRAKESKIALRKALERDRGTLHHHVRGGIATHSIERNDDPTAHLRAPPKRGRLRGLGCNRYNFAVTIMPAGLANMVRPLHFAAIGAFDIARRCQGVMSPPHVAA